MTLRIVDAAPKRGLQWVSQSFALFLRRPLGFSLLFLLFLVAALVLMALPYIGAVLLLASLPLLTLGFMTATRAAQQGQAVHAGHLVEPFLRGGDTARRKVLLHLCGLYALATALAMLLADSVDNGTFERLQLLVAGARSPAVNQQIDELLADPALHGGMAIRFGLSALLSVPFWHAPALVWWHGQGIAQSLFSSTLACWRNKGAFLLYGLAWVAVVVLFGLLAGVVLSMLGTPQLLGMAALPAALMFSTAFYVSLYFTFADSFDAQAPDPRTP